MTIQMKMTKATNQCNPCWDTNGIFHKTRTKNSKMYIETQKTMNSQSNLDKRTDLVASGSLTSDYTTKLQ